VVIIGGGDTGADCLGTAHRQGALSVTQLDYNPEPPGARDETTSPWPTWPLVLRTSPAHDEGGARRFEVAVQRFLDDGQGNVRAMEIAEVKVERDADGRRMITPVGEPMEIPCDLALLAIGFEGVEHMALLDGLGLSLTRRGTLSCGSDWQTDAPGVFVCGDAHRGASLIVWAIAEGRSAAHAVDAYLMGESDLPAPVRPGTLPLAVV
jgi:glutamate synthase (NADPH/NADH) small chain